MYRFFSRGFVALAEGRYSEAFENFQSVTKLDPENSSVRHSFEFLFPSSLFTLDGLLMLVLIILVSTYHTLDLKAATDFNPSRPTASDYNRKRRLSGSKWS